MRLLWHAPYTVVADTAALARRCAAEGLRPSTPRVWPDQVVAPALRSRELRSLPHHPSVTAPRSARLRRDPPPPWIKPLLPAKEEGVKGRPAPHRAAAPLPPSAQVSRDARRGVGGGVAGAGLNPATGQGGDEAAHATGGVEGRSPSAAQRRAKADVPATNV